MAEIIERLTGRTLDDLAKAYVFNPLAMKDTMYRPAKKLWPWIAPTEIDNNLRHRLVQGEVHDENAFAIGGVSGHCRYLQHRARISPHSARCCLTVESMRTIAFCGAHNRAIHHPATAFERHAHARLGRSHRRWLQRPLFFSAQLSVTTGFTGTSIWIDPDRELFVVLLANGSSDARKSKNGQVRPAFTTP